MRSCFYCETPAQSLTFGSADFLLLVLVFGGRLPAVLGTFQAPAQDFLQCSDTEGASDTLALLTEMEMSLLFSCGVGSSLSQYECSVPHFLHPPRLPSSPIPHPAVLLLLK